MQYNALIFGASGFLGTSLILAMNHIGVIPVVISRTPPSQGDYIHVKWSPEDHGPKWLDFVNANSIIINLIGKSVDCRKTPEAIDQILRSRIDSTEYIGMCLSRLGVQPKHWIQMSTAHIYGDSELELTEKSSIGYGLAPEIGRRWEEAFYSVCPDSTLKTVLRTSFVIGESGGAYPILKCLTRFGLGGTIGNGRQGMSWIHQDDFNNLVLEVINNQWTGIILATSPNPVSNKLFMQILRSVLKRPFGLPTPSWVINLASKTIMDIDPDIALYGRYVKSLYLKEKGFEFKFKTLADALKPHV